MAVSGLTKRIRQLRCRNERGTVMVETLPLLAIFIVLLGFGLGFFGVIHTAIMNSMASRTYAFETFRNRSDLTFLRDADISTGGNVQYSQVGARFHIVNDGRVDPSDQQDSQWASARNITFFPSASPVTAGSSSSQTDHNYGIFQIQPRNRTLAVSPAWVMVGYGICLNAECGDGG